MKMMQEFEAYLQKSIPEMHRLLEELCLIPAPSHFEDRRAEFVKNWLEKNGAEGVYLDEAKNVVFPMNCDGKEDLTVFAAHTDTVFPMETPLSFLREDGKFLCPSVGDDTACLVVMLMVIRYLIQKKLQPKGGVLFVANACEEGLGNLQGVRTLFENYKGRIGAFYTFDGKYEAVVNRCVGSHRYSIRVQTEGGHSWGAFGKANAIQRAARLIEDLYTMELPQGEDSRTTFNVGTIEGGTSVNTIAQEVRFLFEYRSNDPDCLTEMTRRFEEKLARHRADPEMTLEVTTVGVRPCGKAADPEKHEAMLRRVVEICERASGLPCKASSGSTDCNIPMSLGIPALCVGLYLGGGAHTREEWVEIDSLEVGARIAAELILDRF